MSTKSKRPLEDRVWEAAEGALAEQDYVSVIDVLTRVGYLHPSHVDGWRKGRVASLEEWIFVAPEKVSNATALFHEWARGRNLTPSETAYLAPTVGPARHLQFTRSGDPDFERAWRTHYLSPTLPEKK